MSKLPVDRPTLWRRSPPTVSNNDRVDQILTWMQRPEAERPTFYTLYFEQIDVAGHDFGPDSPHMRPVVERIDEAMARLSTGLEALGVRARTNLVVVSDHGMAQIPPDHVIFVEDYVPARAVT